MSTLTINLPDIGEGIAEAEVNEWLVSVGDVVAEAIGAPLVKLDVSGAKASTSTDATDSATTAAAAAAAVAPAAAAPANATGAGNTHAVSPGPDIQNLKTSPGKRASLPGKKPLAAPSVRKQAQDQGIDLRLVSGTGPAERITHDDLQAYVENGPATTVGGRRPASGSTEIKVKGMRRAIADKMALSKARIPHITVVEEIDVTDLENLRAQLNSEHAGIKGKLTILPFVMSAIVKGVSAQPEMNARYDDEAGIIHQSNPVHIGIATQTPNGLTVPVVAHAEACDIWEYAAQVTRLSEAARTGKATREELSGSTITITSLQGDRRLGCRCFCSAPENPSGNTCLAIYRALT